MSNWPFMLWQLSMLTISIVIENSIIIGTKQLHTPVLQQCAKNTHIHVDDKYAGSIVKTMKHVCLTASCSRLQPMLKGNIFCLNQPSSLVLNADIQNSIGGGLASVIHSFDGKGVNGLQRPVCAVDQQVRFNHAQPPRLVNGMQMLVGHVVSVAIHSNTCKDSDVDLRTPKVCDSDNNRHHQAILD